MKNESNTEKVRPNPDLLLEQIQADERAQYRGKLRIYFGAIAGVGKTYAMLLGAKKEIESGRHVLIGLVETHKRPDTEKLLEGLPIMPRKKIPFLGHSVEEFDLDAALKAHPDLLILDELAHSNPESCRHPKRWQDVEELLQNGIDVWTTLNVQHIESLNNVVSQITGVPIHETLPDAFFAKANEIILVDTTTDELIQRLKSGKIYNPEQAEKALKEYFKKGNLISLREIAMRRTADCIETDVKMYRKEVALDDAWATHSGLLAVIDGSNIRRNDATGALEENFLRRAAQLAGKLNEKWHAIFCVRSTSSPRNLEHMEITAAWLMRLAEQLGAQTQIVYESDIADAVLDYAQEKQLGRIVALLKPKRFWERQDWLDILSQKAPDLILIRLYANQVKAKANLSTNRNGVNPLRALNFHKEQKEKSFSLEKWRQHFTLKGFLQTSAVICLLAMILYPLSYVIATANIVMIFLAAVILTSLRYGQLLGAYSAILSVIVFDIGFVAPRWTLEVTDLQYLITFTIMLGVGLFIGHLINVLKVREHLAQRRENQVILLLEYAKTLSSTLNEEDTLRESELFLKRLYNAESVFLLPDQDNHLRVVYQSSDAKVKASASLKPSRKNVGSQHQINRTIAQWAYQNDQIAGYGTDTLPHHPYLYLPLSATLKMRGVVAISTQQMDALLVPENRRALDTFTRLLSLTLERVHLAQIANNALTQTKIEQVKTRLIGTLSKELTSPLNVLMSETNWLEVRELLLSSTSRKQSWSIIKHCQDQLQKTIQHLVTMAKNTQDKLPTEKTLNDVAAVINETIEEIRSTKPGIKFNLSLDENLPAIAMDKILMKRALQNLLENASLFGGNLVSVNCQALDAAQGQEVVDGKNHHGCILITISYQPTPTETTDGKAQVPQDSEDSTRELGLMISESIMSAHGGTITLKQGQDDENNEVKIWLPC